MKRKGYGGTHDLIVDDILALDLPLSMAEELVRKIQLFLDKTVERSVINCRLDLLGAIGTIGGGAEDEVLWDGLPKSFLDLIFESRERWFNFCLLELVSRTHQSERLVNGV